MRWKERREKKIFIKNTLKKDNEYKGKNNEILF